MQTICDANLRILNVVGRHAGCTNDQNIFDQCDAKQMFENGKFGDYVLVADGGYKNTPYMATPFNRRQRPTANAYTAAELAYQKALLSTRNTVERSYGLLKRRFPILKYGMQLQRLSLIQKIITVCCMVHNICLQDPTDREPPEVPLNAPVMVEANVANDEEMNAEEENDVPEIQPVQRRRGRPVGLPAPPPPLTAQRRIVAYYEHLLNN